MSDDVVCSFVILQAKEERKILALRLTTIIYRTFQNHKFAHQFTPPTMSKKKTTTPSSTKKTSSSRAGGLCFLDIRDLLKFDSSLHYFSICPACKTQVSEHSDVDFRREQLAKFTDERDIVTEEKESEDDVVVVEEEKESVPDAPRPRKKRLKGPVPAAEAADLVTQGKLCAIIGCVKRPLFNFRGLKPRFCREHKKDDMINIKEKFCQFQCEGGCKNPATHFHRGDSKSKKMCIDHKEQGMIVITVSGLLCKHEGCKKSASFNIKGATARYCLTHKSPEMINVYREKKLCRHEGCLLTCSFNFPGKKVPRFCALHKEKDMINIKTPLCFVEGCPIQPYYNWQGQKKGKFCTTHKEEGMVNLQLIRTNRVCDRSGCEKCACFAFAKTDSARYCSAHKECGMIDVQNATCEFTTSTTATTTTTNNQYITCHN